MIRRLSASACCGEAALVDQEGGLLLGPGDDPLGLLLGLLDDPLALGVDPLRRADLLGHGDTQLIDEAERGGLVDHDVVRQGELLAVRDDRLEALDEEDDVDRRALRGVDRSPAARSGRAAWASAGLSHARTAPDGLGRVTSYSTMSIRRIRRSATSRKSGAPGHEDPGEDDRI